MRPYVIQNLKNDLGETVSARLITPHNSKAKVIEIADVNATIHPEDGTIYECGEASTLTIADYPQNGSFTVVFTSGTEATVLNIPETLHMPENYLVEANTRYEINVRNGYALCAGWAVTEL